MENQQHENSANPLHKHFRQAALYVKLPSNGSFYPEGTLTLPLTGEVGILPMTTKDEIVLRTPDALLNGQGVVNVIQSCCPSIKDAWSMPTVDVDAIIIAIRIASYGNGMDVDTKCPHCKEENNYNIDLSTILDNIHAPSYADKIETEGLKIKLKPQQYADFNKFNMLAFEEQQLLRSLEKLEDDPEGTKAAFDLQLSKIIDLNISMLTNSTAYIELEDGSIVTSTDYIDEFYSNCNNKVIKLVKEKLTKYNKEGAIKPISVVCTSCTKDFDVNLTFDFANFFGNGS